MSNGNGHHWSKFAWRDWSGDKALHSCTIAARGFWVELLCIMHEGDPVGHLTMNGRPATLRQIASSANVTEKEALKLLAELNEAGVFSRTPEGTIYCRRMVRDAAASEAGREHAGKRWNSRHPNGSPIGSPIGGASGVGNRGANGTPNAKNLELESEERPPYAPPRGEGTPASPGTPPAGRRADGSNPREKGTNPRATARREGFVSGGIAVLADRLRQRAEAHHDDDLTDEHSYFAGLKIVDGSRG
jgi:hypothetical protein